MSNYTKARDKIKLSSGEIMTLGQAFDAGLVYPKTTEGFGRGGRMGAKIITLYIARETNGDALWQIGQKLYESRLRNPAPRQENYEKPLSWEEYKRLAREERERLEEEGNDPGP